jgi:hypothetical protein
MPSRPPTVITTPRQQMFRAPQTFYDRRKSRFPTCSPWSSPTQRRQMGHPHVPKPLYRRPLQRRQGLSIALLGSPHPTSGNLLEPPTWFPNQSHTPLGHKSMARLIITAHPLAQPERVCSPTKSPTPVPPGPPCLGRMVRRISHGLLPLPPNLDMGNPSRTHL